MADGRRVRVNGAALRAIMQSERAQEMVTGIAQRMAADANGMSGLSSSPHGYVVHPRVLGVSAHAFVDCGGDTARFDNHKNDTLQKAFYANQGG